MKNQQKINKKVFSVISVILMLAVGFSFFSLQNDDTLKAYAEDFDTVYYFSDNATSQTYRSRLLADGVIDNVVLEYQNNVNMAFTDAFKNNITFLYGNEYFATIENQYVIFETSSDMYFDNNYWSNFTGLLGEIFALLKSNGCKIMFIADLDDDFWQSDAFLNYVDIFVNRDIFYPFASSIINYAIEDCGAAKISNCTFVLDKQISGEVMQPTGNVGPFIIDYLLPFLQDAYETEILAGNMETVLSNRNIKILCECENNSYYDPIAQSVVGTWNESTMTDFYDYYVDNQHVYVVGSTNGVSSTVAESWINFMIDARMATEATFPIYVFNTQGHSLDAYSEDYVYLGGYISGLLYDVIVDFLSDEDLSVYDNWVSLCDVTFLDAPFGDGGWMVCTKEMIIDDVDMGEVFG
ncbi:MAG: hypothetical protein IKD14_02850 [Clostridia bacterium]|nr:hypothetical protein [Clostridia bacterium]